ncbi:hypothetical protein [Bacillus piscicola]|uniref:hypothetical protein n=1 Tax=Bacillus piscicola TaxID=1632684 RepID=UPI001F08E8B9|nr:hypothetical protein [Bacillus piscicola]
MPIKQTLFGSGVAAENWLRMALMRPALKKSTVSAVIKKPTLRALDVNKRLIKMGVPREIKYVAGFSSGLDSLPGGAGSHETKLAAKLTIFGLMRRS